MANSNDANFTGSVAETYESLFVPLIFEAPAADLAGRIAELQPQRVLELAAGTGALTRQLSRLLGPSSTIVASDLNQDMVNVASRIGTANPVEWRVVDAMQLPFEHGAFDLVASQFGVMFFPDRVHAYGEARRVLRPGGTFAFNVWSAIEDSGFAVTVAAALAKVFPDDPPLFMRRTPHGYHDEKRIATDLAAAGFTARPTFDRRQYVSRADAARTVAVAYCEGTPWRGEILARDPQGLERATAAAEAEVRQRYGTGAIEAPTGAVIVTVTA